MKRFIVAICLVVMVALGLAKGRYEESIGDTAVMAVDTNRVSGTVLIKIGLSDGSRKQKQYEGADGYVIVGDISNPGDPAFGNVDTCILTYYSTQAGVKRIFQVDTLVNLPGTSWVWDVTDSIWDYGDVFSVDYYAADSTEDYAGGDDTLNFTLSRFFRLFEED